VGIRTILFNLAKARSNGCNDLGPKPSDLPAVLLPHAVMVSL
jgi:hypothetical protein